MTWFIAFISIGILLGLALLRLFTVKDQRKQKERDELWNRQLKDLLELFKKKKK
jgi:uncharacterized membrane-anchored protein YhcB (DUF1043 family)